MVFILIFDWDNFLPKSTKIFIRPGITDMRKSIYALSYLVQSEMNLILTSKALFVFCNKRKDTVKILYWDGNGFCLWMKKLETDKFPFPQSEDTAKELPREKFIWLLRGIDFRREHKIYAI